MAKDDSQSPDEAPAPAEPAAPIPDGPSPIEELVNQNKSKFALGIIAALLGISAFFIFQYLAAEKERKASTAFTNASTVDELRVVAEDHPGSVAAGNALLRIAHLEAEEEKYDDALASIGTFLSDFSGHPRYAQGVFASGAIADAKGDSPAAESKFQQVLGQFPESDLAPLALLRLGDIAANAGDTDAAKGYFDRIDNEYPANPYIDASTERLNRLKLTAPTPPSDEQKALKEKEEQERKEREEQAKKAAEEARKKAEEAAEKAKAEAEASKPEAEATEAEDNADTSSSTEEPSNTSNPEPPGPEASGSTSAPDGS